MPTSNVSIRLSLQDAEAVRQGLEKLGADGQAALKKLEAASRTPSTGLSAVDKTVADLKGRIEGTAQSIGPLGTLLVGLGPIGLTVAAGIGAAVAIIYEMSKASNELGERASQIRNFAEETGFTTTAIQALTSEGAKFGLLGEQIATGLQRLSVNLDQAHRGTGALYQDLYRINPELAHQVAAAKDVAAAYDLIGKAIKQATDAGNTVAANTIARAAFGRNPGGQGALAADVFASGGTNSLAASYQNAGKALDDGLIKRLATLKSEIAETEQRAKDMGASIFAEDVLERELRAAQLMERMAAAAKEMSAATKSETWGDMFSRWGREIGAGMAASEGMDGGAAMADVRQETLRQSAQRRLDQQMAAGKRSDSELAGFWQPAGHGGSSDAVSKVAEAAKAARVPIEVVLADMKKWMAVLGSAATPAEQLKLKQLELAVAVKENGASASVAARAYAALNDAQTVSAIAARERLGLASQEEIQTVALIQLAKDRRDKYITNAADIAQAEARIARQSEQTFKQEQVANSAFKGLTQLGQTDVNADIDKLATGTLGNLNTALVEVVTNTGNAADAFRNFGLTAIKAIEETILKALILAPIARSLSGALGGGFGGGGGSLTGFALGGIMTGRGPLPLRQYGGGGIANSPQLAMFGEGSGAEAYVPLPDGRAIPAVVNLKGAGGGGHTINSVTNMHVTVPPGTSPQDAHQMAASFARQARSMVKQVVDEQIITHLRTGGMLNPA